MYCLAEFAVSGSLKINLNNGSSGESQGLCLDCVRPRLGSGCCCSCCRLLSWFPAHRDIIVVVVLVVVAVVVEGAVSNLAALLVVLLLPATAGSG